MTDQPPGQGPEQRLPVPREPVEVTPADRFTAPAQAHAVGLTSERAAKIVRQSGSARWVAFLAVTLVTIFILGYYFYELGVPGIESSSRLEKEAAAQQVTDVERGYKLYQANCARCHGDTGQGGIGPILNEQAKLLTHLTPAYLQAVLEVGGRYVCGDPNSLMLAFLEPKGPLNYREVEEIIAFIRAPSTMTFTAVDKETHEETEKTGWRDPGYVRAPDATPVPACWKDAFVVEATPTPVPPNGGHPTPAPPNGGAMVTLAISAQGIAFDTDTLSAPAGVPFRIEFANNDGGIPHNVEILQNGQSVWRGDLFNGVETRTYDVPALAAGTYEFICTVHPNMRGTLTVE
ncbi:MAG TPA: cupredoxin domain-containing protein [Patescibacteria group bacterium]|nr:cupredoxin domain-containing protein [Patescibacteria group bacterium]